MADDLKDLLNGKATTAKYEHSKEPVEVNPKDVVEYTIRVYNEGQKAGYAELIMDDVPSGVEMVAPEYDEAGKPKNTNAKYGWVMYRKCSEGEKVTGNTLVYNDEEDRIRKNDTHIGLVDKTIFYSLFTI